MVQFGLNEQRVLIFSFGLLSEANQESRVVERLVKSGQKWLWVFSLLVILHTCSMGFKSGEYGGSETKVILSRMSWYSGSFSTSRFVFLCQGALSKTRTILLLISSTLHRAINCLKLSMVVSQLNHSGFETKSLPSEGITNPL